MIGKYRLILTFFLVAQAAFAVNNVAVLELIYNESVAEIIKIEESRHMTDELRRQAVMALPKGEYSVLTRDNIIALIPPDEKEAECLAQGCAVDIGRAIGAEYITQGTIGKFGNKLTISVELYETISGKLLSSIVFESSDIEGLLTAIRDQAKPLFQSILDSRLATSAPISVKDSPKAEVSGGMGVPQWIGLGMAVAGIGAGVYGFLQNSKAKDFHDKYMDSVNGYDAKNKWSNVESAKSNRDIGYIVGAALLASGITVYFVF